MKQHKPPHKHTSSASADLAAQDMHDVSLYSLAADDAFDVKAKPPDSQVVLAYAVLFQRVELLPPDVYKNRQRTITQTKKK